MMDYSILLMNQGYTLINDTSVYMNPEYAGISYSDGDEIEKRIAKIIKNSSDLSIFSRQLAAECTDWPSLYHLGSNRANILRPFHPLLQQANVLEIGAGCGAVTRYLGECGANVLALEGTPRRAAIARSRTRDLENVTVLADRFDQFRCGDYRFDVITLIGVLEYAALFTEGEEPAVSMLSRIGELLKPDGKLILAIENQLGLKYFAGAAEDHTGEPMLGIEGRYTDKGPRTFGRKVLRKLLERAGFISQQWMAPFPDYKLPISIVTEQGLNCDDFDSAALAWQSAHRDPQLPTQLTFAPELAWPEIAANGLTLDLANSFLVSATATANVEPVSESETLAYHYSTSGRYVAYCKETLFVKQENNIKLIYNLLKPNLAYRVEGNRIVFNISTRANYFHGESLYLKLLKIVTKNNWKIKEIGEFLLLYLEIIESYLAKKGYTINFQSISSLLPGTCFDLIPQNILCLTDGSYQIIDQEWMLKEEMPLGWLLYRTLLQLIYGISRFGKTPTIFPKTRLDLFIASFASAGFTVTAEELENYALMENRIYSDINKLEYKPIDTGFSDLNTFLSKDSTHTLLKKQADKLTKNQHDIKVYKKIEEELNKENLNKDKTIKNIKHELTKQKEYNKFLIKKLINQSKKFNLNNLKNYFFCIRKIRDSNLFCYEWYKNKYPEIQKLNIDSLIYFYYFGCYEGQNPNPYFDSSWYLKKYTDVSRKKINPLLHYILFGSKEGKNPSPYFDTSWYLTEYKDVKKSKQNPLAHFLMHGSKEGRNPNPYFDSLWYKSTYPEAEASGMEPFLHYITIGFKEGKNPSPYFHTIWYLNKYRDVYEAEIEPLYHYIDRGWQEDRDPNPLFNSKWYRKKYLEDLKSNYQPLLDYIQSWATDSRNPNEFFDVEWYLSRYPEVKNKGLDPLIHFLYYGVEERKNPCPSFDTDWYLKEYQDVRDNGINPLEHYIHYGQHEGRYAMEDHSIKIDLNDAQPIGILHTPHTRYVADQIVISLRKISIKSFTIQKSPPEGYGDGIYFVICPQMFPLLPERYISFQMEQTINSRWFNMNYYNILEKSLAILDYSVKNIKFLKNEFKIQNKQLYYIPIDHISDYNVSSQNQEEIYDILFYGDPHSERRQNILSCLMRHFNIKIIDDTFGQDLYNEILKSKLIINIHYYEGALLETTRIWECLSLNKLIISEKSVDIDEYYELHELVDFVEINDTDSLIKRINYWIANEKCRKIKIEKITEILNKRINKFEFFFFRFMLAHENISFDEFWLLCGQYLKLNNDKINCLTLPEFIERKELFEINNSRKVYFFDGLRHYKHGWIGCGMSYKLMIKLAKQKNLDSITICEDDVKFLDNFDQNFNCIKNYIQNSEESWDIFSGFMSDISDDIEIKEIVSFYNQELLRVDKMISMACNCYNNSVYDDIISWNESNIDVNSNTIDRFLEQKECLIIYLAFPFLVDHNEELKSTVWRFSNSKYNYLINKSVQLLNKKITEKRLLST